MNSPVLSLRGVTRTYTTGTGDLTVLKGVDLDIFPGELVGLIGPSGSGKSSLLHAAGLLERPTSGQILIDGEDVGGLDERARTRLRLSRVGFVYQFHHLLPEFTALDNVAMPLRIRRLASAEARERASEALVQVGGGDHGARIGRAAVTHSAAPRPAAGGWRASSGRAWRGTPARARSRRWARCRPAAGRSACG